MQHQQVGSDAVNACAVASRSTGYPIVQYGSLVVTMREVRSVDYQRFESLLLHTPGGPQW